MLTATDSFETIVRQDGEYRDLPRHLSRLHRGCRALGMSVPSDTEILNVLQLDRADVTAQPTDAVVKLFAVRENTGRGYRPGATAKTMLLLEEHPLPVRNERAIAEGITTSILPYRLPCNSQLAGIKHLNRLDQVLLSADLGADEEGIALDHFGRVIEGTRSNIFLVVGGSMVTPALDSAGVAGVARERILDWCQHECVRIEIRDVFPYELARADELFFTNSIIGAWPIVKVEGVREKGRGVGEMTRSVQAYLGIL